MSRNLPISNFKWVEKTSEFNEDFIKSYDDESEEGYFLDVDVQYPENLHNLYNDLPFLSERMKIEKVEKHVEIFQDKDDYFIHIKKFKKCRESLNLIKNLG